MSLQRRLARRLVAGSVERMVGRVFLSSAHHAYVFILVPGRGSSQRNMCTAHARANTPKLLKMPALREFCPIRRAPPPTLPVLAVPFFPHLQHE